jgi:hypothetical protein
MRVFVRKGCEWEARPVFGIVSPANAGLLATFGGVLPTGSYQRVSPVFMLIAVIFP